jgi:ornithine cyclodeaminase
MQIWNLDEIRSRIDDLAAIDCMREALIAHSYGECDTPMPMHLSTGTSEQPGGEVHMKSSYRRGGKYFALKMATTFHGAGNGMIMLASAETGEPVALLEDAGHLTDVRTAAVTAMVARELGRADCAIGILGTGIQARLTARFHKLVMPLESVYVWGRTPENSAKCAEEIRKFVPDVHIVRSAAEVAASVNYIVTCTSSRSPLLYARDLQPGTHISAIGADSPGKQELDPGILRAADILLADSITQCEKLGELQHAPDQLPRAVEIGEFCENHSGAGLHTRPGTNMIADFTGLGVEDLYIAEMIFSKNT